MAVVITLCVALVICVIALLCAVYHQLLLVNEVNKRLIVLVENSVENERMTADLLADQIEEKEAIVREHLTEGTTPKEESVDDEYDNFDPHEALDSLS